MQLRAIVLLGAVRCTSPVAKQGSCTLGAKPATMPTLMSLEKWKNLAGITQEMLALNAISISHSRGE